ncbi:hypothetical protein BDV93DRAFT_513200 [Ceratobasidium sp. AG-I]|nr:hypothetical protein BDV93DRAFT_513200 [Ceratobasidium sp. AG-I]
MSLVPRPKAIVVNFYTRSLSSGLEGYGEVLLRSATEWHVHGSHLSVKSRCLFSRIFRHSKHYKGSTWNMGSLSVIQRSRISPKSRQRICFELGAWFRRAQRPGRLTGHSWSDRLFSSRYTAIRQLTAALDAGTSTGASRTGLPCGRIPIKSSSLLVSGITRNMAGGLTMHWVPSLPSTVENLLCMGWYDAYVVQRGLPGQIIRKEAWRSTDGIWGARLDWLVYVSSDLVLPWNRSGLARGVDQALLLSTTTHPNYTRHYQGTSCNDAISTGGQITRVSKVMWRDLYHLRKCLVWSYQSFEEGGYDNLSNAPLLDEIVAWWGRRVLTEASSE